MTQTKLNSDSKNKIPIANKLAEKQQEVGVAEFFAKNRHLLGFDNKRKSLMTTIKEAVDNALDACEEASVLPEIIVEVIDMGNDRFKVIVEDNGPGIVRTQIPKIFAKLLYGSKFHKISQSRGQQGIGISASVMYGQITTGKPAKITSKISKDSPANYFELKLNTQKNTPEIIKERIIEDWNKDHGTRIELDIEASYIKGSQSIDEYIKQTAVTNPHSTIIYTNPKAEQYIFARATNKKPHKPIEIKPHLYGVELGVMMRMLEHTSSKTLQQFLMSEFTRVGIGTAKTICENSSLLPNTKPKKISRDMAEKLMEGIKKTKIMSPSAECISPIGDELLEKSLKKEIKAEFYATTTRPPMVYRGYPFIIEAGIAYGGSQPSEGSVSIMRFANRVPLLYQQGGCATTKAITGISWRLYGLSQSKNSLPVGPCTILIHIASVWVPFTSESKEAIAHYPEIIKEMKLALQEVGRKLNSYIKKKKKINEESKKRSYIEKYIPHVGIGLKDILKLTEAEEMEIVKQLKDTLEFQRGKIKDIRAKNDEYDEEFAKIGKEDKNDQE